jgi:phosphoribosylformimino-5-aminoimidazole carboxamide ribotide isomerase
MKILFAVDLMDGKCVRLTKGDFSKVKVYSSDPKAQVEEMVNKGARDFHIIDLDGAREGKPKNQWVIREMRKIIPGYMQVGGGIRSREVVRMFLEWGVDGIIVGTKAYRDPDFLRSLKGLGKIVLGVDIANGKPMIMGWKKEAKIGLNEILEIAEACEVSSLLVTSIERDGTLSGPDFETLRTIKSQTKIPIIASGGITRKEDIKALKGMGMDGVVVGKAIYERILSIEDVIELS